MEARQGTCLRRIFLLGLQGTLLATGVLDTVGESCPRGLGCGPATPPGAGNTGLPADRQGLCPLHALLPHCPPGWTLAERLVPQVTIEPTREGTVCGRRSPRRGLLSVGFRGSRTTREQVPQGQRSVALSGSSGEGSGGWATTRESPTVHASQGPAPGCVGGLCGCGTAWVPAVTRPCREAQVCTCGGEPGVKPQRGRWAVGEAGGGRGRHALSPQVRGVDRGAARNLAPPCPTRLPWRGSSPRSWPSLVQQHLSGCACVLLRMGRDDPFPRRHRQSAGQGDGALGSPTPLPRRAQEATLNLVLKDELGFVGQGVGTVRAEPWRPVARALSAVMAGEGQLRGDGQKGL